MSKPHISSPSSMNLSSTPKRVLSFRNPSPLASLPELSPDKTATKQKQPPRYILVRKLSGHIEPQTLVSAERAPHQRQQTTSLRRIPHPSSTGDLLSHKQNIFNQPPQQGPPDNNQIDFDKGPRFKKDGSLIPYSVVGAPALYTKLLDRETLRLQQKAGEPHQQQQQLLMKPSRFQKTHSILESSLNANMHGSQQHINTTIPSLRNIQPPNLLQTHNNNSNTNNTKSQQPSLILSEQGELRTPVQKTSFSSRSQLNSTNSAFPLIQNLKKSHITRQFEHVTKEELLTDMNKAEKRINSMEQPMRRSTSTHSNISQYHITTRETRTLQKHEATVQQWRSSIASLSRRSQRNAEDSVMLRSESYRKKIEQIRMLDNLRCDNEIFGQRLWYFTLRNHLPKTEGNMASQQELNSDNVDLALSRMNIRRIEPIASHNKQTFESVETIPSDIFSNFNTKTNYQKREIELIRQPNLSQDLSGLSIFYPVGKSPSGAASPRLRKKASKSTNNFLFQDRINEMGTSQKPQWWANKQNIAEITIEGKNVFELEFQALKNDGRPLNYKYERFPFQNQKGVQEVKQIDEDSNLLGKSYNPAEMAKIGLLGLQEFQ